MVGELLYRELHRWLVCDVGDEADRLASCAFDFLDRVSNSFLGGVKYADERALCRKKTGDSGTAAENGVVARSAGYKGHPASQAGAMAINGASEREGIGHRYVDSHDAPIVGFSVLDGFSPRARFLTVPFPAISVVLYWF